MLTDDSLCVVAQIGTSPGESSFLSAGSLCNIPCRQFDDAMEELSELIRRNRRSLDIAHKALLTGIT